MLEMESRKLKILYGSQTGTSQEVAERFWRDSKRYYFQGPVLALDDYPVTQLIFETLIIFVCSTTGDGKEPDNMKKFWKFLLRKNLPLDSLKGLRFAVLGLGDSSYTKFNYAAKKLYRRLLQLGGVALLDVGLADDQHDLGPDAVIDKWSEQLWKTLGEIFPLPNGTEPLSENNLFSARWTIKILNTESENNDIEVSDIIWIQNCEKHTVSLEENTCLLTVKKNIRTTAESHFQDTPVIMVGPGTGVAPFRSFIQEKVALNQARADLLYLFFGCRNHDGDFHCRDEWLTLQENEKLTMFCAFSRDQENKVYVQHIMKEQAALLWSLFSSQQASFYLAGRSDNMPAAVKDVLINDVACSCGQLSSEEASQWLARLEACGRYQVETWS